MSIFNRIAGLEEPRLPWLRVLSDLILVMDGQVTLSSLEYETGLNADKEPLSQSEQAEAVEYMTAIGGRIQGLVASMLKAAAVQYRATLASNDPLYLSSAEVADITATATLAARAIVRSQLEDYLLNTEAAKLTINGFRALMGLAPL